ncbi:ABC transporter permease [Lagierella massiliensis]|uniref:ABC transporter permease n=1 Tax=Lagierella massiliensis TaxID=1689303 RepID=UPI0006D7DC6D|nr:ABC transporter permease [Lagierella massiliensis]
MFKLALKNVFRRKNQVLIAIFVTLISTLVFIVVYNIYKEIDDGIKFNEDRMGADVVIYPAEAESNPQDFLFSGVAEMKYFEEDKLMERIPKDKIEKVTNQFFVKTLQGGVCCGTDKTYRIVGVDGESDFLIKPWLENENIEKIEDGMMVLGQNIGGEFGRKAFLLNNVFDVKGRLYRTGSGFDESIFMDLDTVRDLGKKTFSTDYFDEKDPQKLITTSFIKLKDGVDVNEFIDNLNVEGFGAKVIHVSQVRDMVKEQANSFLLLFLIFALLVFLITAIAISTLYNMIAKERKTEIGYLRSIGLSKKKVLQESFLEVLIQSGTAGLIGAVLGGLSTVFITERIRKLMALPLGIDVNQIIISMVLSLVFAIVISLLATIRPILKNSSIEPSQAITGGI